MLNYVTINNIRGENMNELLEKHFDVQKGMYFDDSMDYQNTKIFFSKNIDDCFWNYIVLDVDDFCSAKLVDEIEKQFKKIKRDCCLYVTTDANCTISFNVLEYIDNYSLVNEESWLVYSKKELLNVSNEVVMVNDEKSKNDFLNVFVEAYGGAITLDSPYGELSQGYITALSRTLNNTEKFIHFVVYDREIPVSIASLCIDGEYAGIYNVGTKPSHRKKGYGADATFSCINFMIKKGYKSIFLQTEKDSNVELWYQHLGFLKSFVGKMYVKVK